MRVTNNSILHNETVGAQRKTYLVLILVALFLIAMLDHATGDVPFQHLYYLPIIVGATEFGFGGGLTVSLASVALYHIANARPLTTHQFREADVVQSFLFLIVGLVAAKLAHDAKRLRLLSITDDLTGLHNLRSFETHLANFVQQAKKNGWVLSVLVVDVDRLKVLNDTYGHLAGADAVRTVGQVIARQLPSGAVACRYGGDEFVMAIPDCDSKRATIIAQTLCRSVSQEAPTLAMTRFAEGTLSVSVGTASQQIPKHSDLLEVGEALFRSADSALYRAKEMGRNAVASATVARFPQK
jgi:diguanylate cyclase (GGDEF)-like protein